MRFAKTAGAAVVVLALMVGALLGTRPSTPMPAQRVEAPVSSAVRSSAIETDARSVARARWEERRARIRAAHARDAETTPTRARAYDRDDGDRAEEDEVDDDAWFGTFVDETTTLLHGCEELIGEHPKAVRLTAHLIGSPELGTIVESVEVAGAVERADELTECLTEGMYTLGLGDPPADFERDAVLGFGLIDEVANEGWLTPAQLAETRQQMIDGGLDPAKDPMVYADGDPPRQ